MTFHNLKVTMAMAAMLAATCFAAKVPALASDQSVSSEEVLAAVASAAVPVRSAQVEFLTPIVLNYPGAALKLAHIERSHGDSALARLYCAGAGGCLPFFVILRWSDPQERQAALGPVRSEPVPMPSVREAQTAKPLLVRAGHGATLLLDNAKMHIATPIICLQNGSLGQQIRVASLDHKRVVTAEVVDAGLLKGSL